MLVRALERVKLQKQRLRVRAAPAAEGRPALSPSRTPSERGAGKRRRRREPPASRQAPLHHEELFSGVRTGGAMLETLTICAWEGSNLSILKFCLSFERIVNLK